MSRRLLPVTLSALLLACSCEDKPVVQAPADAGPPVLTEKEPNDSAAGALVIERSSIVEANLGADPAKADADWYVFTSSLPRTVDFTVTCPPGADVAIELVDETGTVLASINTDGAGASERFPDLDVSGKAFVRVVGLKKGAGGAYKLTATFADRQPGYELEPNDRRVDATSVALGQAISGTLSHGSDVDWFRYELPSSAPETEAPAGSDEDAGEAGAGAAEDAGIADAGEVDAGPPPTERRLALRVDVSQVEGVAFDVQVMTEAEAVLFAAKSREGGPLSLRNVGVRESDRVIYVVVRSAPVGTGKDAKRGYNASTSYTLTVAPEEAGGSAEYEPNDERDKATELPSNSYREGFISPGGDVDYFQLVTDGPSLAKLNLEGVEKVDLILSVVQVKDGKEETVLKANEGGVKEPERLNNVSCDKSCFIRVEAAARKVDGKWVKDNENADQAYRLSSEVVPDDGTEEREPNNAAASASPLPPGKSIRGTVFPKKDVDYFAVDLRDRQVKTPLKATLLGVLKVDVGLYLHRVEDDGKLTLVQTSDSAKGDKPETIRYSAEPGLYVFEVRDVKHREANFQDSYQLTVEEGD
ncbi:MAG: ABC transporter substrate-binding protein [Myxococcota bacterium]